MSKALDNYKDIIEAALEKAFNDFSDSYDHETYECNGSEYITERSAMRCLKDFKENFDSKDFIQEYLVESLDLQLLLVNRVDEKEF